MSFRILLLTMLGGMLGLELGTVRRSEMFPKYMQRWSSTGVTVLSSRHKNSRRSTTTTRS